MSLISWVVCHYFVRSYSQSFSVPLLHFKTLVWVAQPLVFIVFSLTNNSNKSSTSQPSFVIFDAVALTFVQKPHMNTRSFTSCPFKSRFIPSAENTQNGKPWNEIAVKANVFNLASERERVTAIFSAWNDAAGLLDERKSPHGMRSCKEEIACPKIRGDGRGSERSWNDSLLHSCSSINQMSLQIKERTRDAFILLKYFLCCACDI